MAEYPMIRVSKLNAARRQLVCAIELRFAEKDEVSIHTLAAAAHQLIHDLNVAKGSSTGLFDSSIVKEKYRAEYISFLRKDMNFFKHADKDAEEIAEFPPMSSVLFMIFASKGLENLGETPNDIELTLFQWLAFHHPNWVTAEFRELIAKNIPVEYITEILSMSKKEFFEGMMRLRAETRFKASF